jgi:hypothetical protein
MTQRNSLGLSEARGELAAVPSPGRTEAQVRVARAGEGECARCEAMQEQLHRMREERDQALMDLARERETTNALRLALPPVNVPQLSSYGPDIDPYDPPFRYVLADRANKGLKTVLGPLHGALKAVGQKALDPRKKK